MQREETANLDALISGMFELNRYQKSLAKNELDYLFTENKMLKQALDETDRKLLICEGTCDIHEKLGKELQEENDNLLYCLKFMADYYLHEKEVDDADLKLMQERIIDLLSNPNSI